MLSFAPRIDSRLIAAAELLDSPTVRIAETNRRVGQVAQELGLPRPSFEQVRTIIHLARRRGRMPTAGDVLLDVAFRAPPTALIEHFVGTLPTER